MLSVALLLLGVGLLVAAFSVRRRRAVALGLAAAGVAVLAVWAPVTGGHEVRKLIAALLMPVGLLWLALLAVAWWAARLGQQRLTTACWALWLGLTVVGNGGFGGALITWLERDYAAVDALTLPPFDAVLVLGGGVTRTDHGQITLGESGDRAILAARLYHAGKAGVLVTSGPALPPGPLPDTSVPEITARLWQDLGVAGGDIVLLEGPRSTREEVERFVELLTENGWSRVGLVTSAFHLKRAMRLCRRAGLEVTPLPANLSGPSTPLRPRDLVPSSSALEAARTALWELLGMLAGR